MVSPKCFVAVLDWGLGHATRCVPIIRQLQAQNASVVIGGSGLSLEFLKAEFPELLVYQLPSYRIVYPEKRSLLFSLVFQLPRIYRAILKEKKIIDSIIAKEKIEFILSDNRYGCYSTKIRSIFIGHQLNLQMPNGFLWLSRLVNKLHLNRVKKFNQVWVPDESTGFQFSGVLSNSQLLNAKRIGILSRFGNSNETQSDVYEIVVLISGPEPQRTIFENMIRHQLQKSGRKSLMMKGQPGRIEKTEQGLLTEYNHLRSHELEVILVSARIIIARSGYSTIMDMATLGKRVIFIPTPGQSEQEYLAQYLMDNEIAFAQPQHEFDLEKALRHSATFGPMPKTQPNSGLYNTIQEWLCD